MAEPLKWKWDNGFYFAHAPSGMWTIEQRRGRFLLTLDLPNTRNATQDIGNYTTSAKAKAAAGKAHRIITRDFLRPPRAYSNRKRNYQGR